jgi:FAD/FMN-containing dehydrogenase
VNIVGELRGLLGQTGVLDAAEVATRSAGAYRPDNLKACALARPATTAEVSSVMRWCHDNGIAVVTQGGLTGLVHGGDAEPDQLILSLERMRAIENIDPAQRTATVQAGVVLQVLQQAVEEQQLIFPLDFGARGTATLGGIAATNAGGNSVIRYGMMRDMVLGLEVVLADGTIVSSMNNLIKNNTGYDLKQLFIGSEGTLGVITRLVLSLREKPSSTNVAIVAAPSFVALAKLLKHMDRSLAGTFSAFEVMWQSFYKLVTTPPAKGKPPLSQEFPYYALIESQGSDRESDTTRFNAALESAMEQDLIVDAAVSQSDSDCHAFWSLRDDVEQVIHGGIPVVFDISLPINRMEKFVDQLRDALPGEVGEHRLWVYGHMGDGNLHVNVQVNAQDYIAKRPKIEALVYAGVKSSGGSVSAEHGIGMEKKPWLPISRNETELALMRTIKQALDPQGILNPGKIF